jgi:hypothetical protein
MLLLTEEEDYKAAFAFRFLQQFSQNAVEVGLNKLNLSSTISRHKKSPRERRLPGRGMALSEK